jgi:hypothetical protein
LLAGIRAGRQTNFAFPKLILKLKINFSGVLKIAEKTFDCFTVAGAALLASFIV